MSERKDRRLAERRRRTKETDVRVRLALDGAGRTSVATGIGFFDHMLELFGHHGRFDLAVEAQGDLHVDAHHTVEDVGLVLGETIAEALGEHEGIERFAHVYVPLDEALSRVVVDLCGRPYLGWRVRWTAERVGEMPTELFEDFFRALCDRARMTLHVDLVEGRNNHHIAETIFKGLGRALAAAVRRGRRDGVPSTKGTLTR